MSNKDHIATITSASASLNSSGEQHDNIFPRGVYTFQCHDKDGNLLWEDTIHNLVTTVGANEILDKAFAGSGYTATNYMGLISSVSYGAGVVNGDTMASHAGWVEAGGTNAPAYTGSRPTCAWSAASARSKSLSSPLSFTFTSPGTLKGSFITTVATKDGATGIIISGGTFTGGDQPVASGNTVTAGYSLSM